MSSLRESALVTATAGAWGRQALENAWKYLLTARSFGVAGAYCFAHGVRYLDYLREWRRASREAVKEVKAEAGGALGDEELYDVTRFDVTFHAPRPGCPAAVDFVMPEAVKDWIGRRQA